MQMEPTPNAAPLQCLSQHASGPESSQNEIKQAAVELSSTSGASLLADRSV